MNESFDQSSNRPVPEPALPSSEPEIRHTLDNGMTLVWPPRNDRPEVDASFAKALDAMLPEVERLAARLKATQKPSEGIKVSDLLKPRPESPLGVCPPLADDPTWTCAHPKCGTPEACSREQGAVSEGPGEPPLQRACPVDGATCVNGDLIEALHDERAALRAALAQVEQRAAHYVYLHHSDGRPNIAQHFKSIERIAEEARNA
jgi:hypothetical protein